MLDFIGNLIKSILPSPDLPTKEYLMRVILWFVIGFLIVSGVYFATANTDLGAKWGLKKIPSDELPKITHVEIARDYKGSFQALLDLRGSDKNILGSFVVIMYNITTGNIITNDDRKNTKALIWIATSVDSSFNNITTIEQVVDTLRPTIQERFTKSSDCFSDILVDQPLQILNRGIPNLHDVFYTSCPLYNQTNNYVLGATISFLTLPPDNTVTTKPPLPESVSQPDQAKKGLTTYQEIALFPYQDRLRRTTVLIANSYRSFSTKYQFFYR